MHCTVWRLHADYVPPTWVSPHCETSNTGGEHPGSPSILWFRGCCTPLQCVALDDSKIHGGVRQRRGTNLLIHFGDCCLRPLRIRIETKYSCVRERLEQASDSNVSTINVIPWLAGKGASRKSRTIYYCHIHWHLATAQQQIFLNAVIAGHVYRGIATVISGASMLPIRRQQPGSGVDRRSCTSLQYLWSLEGRRETMYARAS